MSNNRFSQRSKKIRIIVVIVLLLLVNIVPIAIILNNPIEPRMFTELHSFSKLESYILDYLAPEQDENIAGLNYADFFCCNLSYNDVDYTVYAYKFDSVRDAHLYYCNMLDVDYREENACMLKQTGLDEELPYNHHFYSNLISHTNFYIYCGTYAMCINGGNYKDFVTFYNWLTNGFPIETDQLSWSSFYN